MQWLHVLLLHFHFSFFFSCKPWFYRSLKAVDFVFNTFVCTFYYFSHHFNFENRSSRQALLKLMDSQHVKLPLGTAFIQLLRTVTLSRGADLAWVSALLGSVNSADDIPWITQKHSTCLHSNAMLACSLSMFSVVVTRQIKITIQTDIFSSVPTHLFLWIQSKMIYDVSTGVK